jgi:hypothetical protein
MKTDSVLFAQLVSYLSHDEFKRSVEKYGGNKWSKSFSCWDQYLCLAFAQLTYRESLRDIEACLRSQGSKLYHLGIRGAVSRSTLAYANDHRDWRIYADFTYKLISKAQKLYLNDDLGIVIKSVAYALDSTTIDLCLELFPWAKFRTTKAGVKIHTLLNLRGNIPSFISISAAKMADVRILDELSYQAGAFYIFDRAYLDYARLYIIELAKAFFVTRAKRRMSYRILSTAKRTRQGAIRADLLVELCYDKVNQKYPTALRLIEYFDAEQKRRLTFLTNNLTLDPLIIAQLYKSRWRIELFFKWIKQHLRIKSFYGTSDNAVRTQIWIAISVYVLIAIVKKQLSSTASMHSILQVLSINAVSKVPILRAFSDMPEQEPALEMHNQLTLQELFLGQ